MKLQLGKTDWETQRAEHGEKPTARHKCCKSNVQALELPNSKLQHIQMLLHQKKGLEPGYWNTDTQSWTLRNWDVQSGSAGSSVGTWSGIQRCWSAETCSLKCSQDGNQICICTCCRALMAGTTDLGLQMCPCFALVCKGLNANQSPHPSLANQLASRSHPGLAGPPSSHSSCPMPCS